MLSERMSTFCCARDRSGRQSVGRQEEAEDSQRVERRGEEGNPNLRGDENADERARLEVPYFEVAVLAAGVDGLPAHDDGEHRSRAALERVQQHRRRIRGCELPELWERIAFRVPGYEGSEGENRAATGKIAQPISECGLAVKRDDDGP